MARATCGYAEALVLARGLLPDRHMEIIGANIAWGAIEPEMPVQYADLWGRDFRWRERAHDGDPKVQSTSQASR